MATQVTDRGDVSPQEEIAVINATLQGLRQEIQGKLESHANL
jgi:hypothetical protein